MYHLYHVSGMIYHSSLIMQYPSFIIVHYIVYHLFLNHRSWQFIVIYHHHPLFITISLLNLQSVSLFGIHFFGFSSNPIFSSWVMADHSVWVGLTVICCIPAKRRDTPCFGPRCIFKCYFSMANFIEQKGLQGRGESCCGPRRGVADRRGVDFLLWGSQEGSSEKVPENCLFWCTMGCTMGGPGTFFWGGGNAAFAFVWLKSRVEICGLKGQRFILVPLTWPFFFCDRSRSYSWSRLATVNQRTPNILRIFHTPIQPEGLEMKATNHLGAIF